MNTYKKYLTAEWQEEAREYYKNTFYVNNDIGHKIDHIDSVFVGMVELAHKVKAKVDIDVIFMCAYLHDIKSNEDRKNHHTLAGEYVEAISDPWLSMFSQGEITLIANAVREHRASRVVEPFSMYSTLIRLADKGVPEFQAIVERIAKANVKSIPANLSTEEHGKLINKVIHHLEEKYSRTGYITTDVEYVTMYKEELETLWKRIESYSTSELGSIINLIVLNTIG